MEMKEEEFEKLLEALRGSSAHVEIYFIDILDNHGYINNCFENGVVFLDQSAASKE